MKSISDILNSMVHPTEQGSLLGGNQTASAQGPNSSVGSFSDVLNRLASQNAAVANAPTNTANGNTAANSNIQNTGSTGFSDISVTEVQVSEKVQSNDLNQATLSNIENAAVSMAMVLSKLVNLASNLQNLNQAQAQNLIVSASGGAISASQAQQLVTQIANLKNQNSGQNVLNLIPEQQNALLLQMMQSMVQNQQVTLTQSADTQNNQNSLLGGSQGSSSLQFNFAGNQSGQSGNAQVESISINIETLNLQVSNSNQQSQVSSANAAQSTNLTDATTQKLTQLLQQLNVTPSSTPVNIQVQTSVAATNSPEMTKNFQNLIQILTQAGAGQAVLSNYLTQSKNNSENSIFEQAVNQLSQTQNATVIQSVSVTAVSENESTNSTSISNSGQNNSAVGQARLLNDSLGAQNIQLTAQNPQGQSNDQVQAAFTTGVQALQTTSPITNVQVPQAPLATNVAQNVSVQPVTNQALTSAAVTNATQISPVQTATNQKAPAVTNVPQNVAFQPTNQSQATALVTNIQQAPAVSDMAPNNPIQPANQPQITAQTFNLTTQIPIATNVTQTTQGQTANNQPQPAPAASVSTAPVVPIAESAQNKTNQTAVNPNSQTALSQPRDVFSNGHLEALNGIVARFNNAVISGAGNPNTINNENNINQYPTETQVQNQVAPIQAAVPTPVATPITPIVTSVENVVLNNQNTQQANNLTSNNVQNQLVQPTSPIAQSAQNTFVQTASNTISNNLVNTTATPALSTTNNSSTTVNPPTSMASTTPVTQQIVTANQSTVAVTSASGGAPVSVASSNPVITQPVTNPASMTAQNVPAATVTGEIAKASMPVLILSNANSNNNAPAISAVSAVSASSSVQPVSAQAVSQTSNTLETSTNLNMAGNSAKDTLSDTTDLQNLSAMINSGMAATTDKTGNSFQNTVNTVVNSNPNGGVDSAQILNQITQQVAAQTADAKMVSRLSFQLVPESLGRVTVQVALVDQAISARITVSNPDVREVLQQHMVDLKAALSQAGLQIDQMQVNVQGGGAGLLGQYYQYQQEGSSYRESAWTPANTEEQPQNADNLGVLTAIGSNSVLNFLV